MSTNLQQARSFFEACETGQGWEACQAYCHPNATFSSQTGALSDISTLEDYTEWMKGLMGAVPDARYDLKFFEADGDADTNRDLGCFFLVGEASA